MLGSSFLQKKGFNVLVKGRTYPMIRYGSCSTSESNKTILKPSCLICWGSNQISILLRFEKR